MSEAAPEEIELPRVPDAAFSALMDVLAPEEAAAPAAAGGDDPAPGAGTAAGGAGEAAAPAVPVAGAAPVAGGAAAAGATAPARDAGAAGGDPQPAAGDAGQPGAAGGDATPQPALTEAPNFGELSQKFEERITQSYQESALEEARKEYAQYFEAIQKHPRLLVGQQVPAIGKEGSEILRDAQDAKDWQEAVKSELVAEINSRVSKQMDESRELLTTVHSSIELFQNNADLVPGTKGFDADLANRFVALATPYELRVEGKLRGYSIPVQPIIDQLRSQIAAERAKAPAAVAPVAGATQSAGAAGAAASTPAAPAAAPQASDAPQAGIESKAGNSSSSEDFSALFGTLGLPNLRI